MIRHLASTLVAASEVARRIVGLTGFYVFCTVACGFAAIMPKPEPIKPGGAWPEHREDCACGHARRAR